MEVASSSSVSLCVLELIWLEHNLETPAHNSPFTGCGKKKSASDGPVRWHQTLSLGWPDVRKSLRCQGSKQCFSVLLAQRDQLLTALSNKKGQSLPDNTYFWSGLVAHGAEAQCRSGLLIQRWSLFSDGRVSKQGTESVVSFPCSALGNLHPAWGPRFSISCM